MPEIKLISWNLFHGRDHPPEGSLHTLGSKLFGTDQRGDTHVQVNRSLLDEFATVLSEAEWDVALLQECPPRWRGELAGRCRAHSHRVLTSRNQLGSLRGRIASLNPDLMGSWEGGSNLTLVRRSAGEILQRRELVLHRGRPERRSLAFTRLTSGICVANLHASTVRALARAEVVEAARRTGLWAGRDRLVFGGDLNLRPSGNPTVFEALAETYGLAGPTGPDAIDHLLMNDADRTLPTDPWPTPRRELGHRSLAIRLSDHEVIEAGMIAPGIIAPTA